MNLFLIRHGECLGQSDPNYYSEPDSPLSPLGKQQSQLTAEYLSHFKLTHIICSPLIRALETATPIAESCDLPIIVWTDLREGFTSYHRGYSLTKLQHLFPSAQFSDDITEQGWHHGNDHYSNWQPRCERALQKLNLLAKNSYVVMVSHGGFGNYFLHSVLGLNFEQPAWFELANCSISHFRFVPNPKDERPDWPLYPPVNVEVHSINAVAHLTTGITEKIISNP
jgi:broad specificity phosphatase PhoE